MPLAASAATLSTITSPQPNSTLAGSRVEFVWTQGSGVNSRYLYIGTAVGKNDVVSKSVSGRSVTVSNLPVNGKKIYVRLWSYTSSWKYKDYAYTASGGNDGGTGGDNVLVNGVPQRNLSGNKGSWKYFKIAIPAGAKNLTIKLSGNSGDADLYTRWGAKPTSSNYDQRPYQSGSNETISYSSPKSGTLHVGISAYSAYSATSLVASYTSDDGGNEEGTFIISAVNDGLNNYDMTLMANGLKAMGYTQSINDTDTSTQEMKNYLNSGKTVYYHTGHGFIGGVATSDGSITSSSVTLKCKHTYFATCLSLSDTNWKSRFGSSAQTLLGYTKTSFDGTDNDVINSVVRELKNGKSHAYAWYLANNAISSLSDRWAMYVREGNSIAEYSARNGTNPSSSTGTKGQSDWESISTRGTVFVSKDLFASRQVKKSAGGALADIAFEKAEQETVTLSDEFNMSTKTTLNKSEARKMADEVLAQAQLDKSDAVFKKIIPIAKRVRASGKKETVGYSVFYVRVINGVEVCGNGIADYICVTISGDYVSSISSYWPTLCGGVAKSVRQLMSAEDAVKASGNAIAASLKGGEVHFTDVQLVYGTQGPNGTDSVLVPAYQLVEKDGLNILLNAETGNIMK